MIPPLYKFLKADTAKLVLTNCTLRWASPRDLNDPFDLQTGIQPNLSVLKIAELAVKRIWLRHRDNVPPGNGIGAAIDAQLPTDKKLSLDDISKLFLNKLVGIIDLRFSEFDKEIIESLAKSKILCLSSDLKQNLMWSHYSDSHKGIALELRLAPTDDPPIEFPRPVSYFGDAPNNEIIEELVALISGMRDLDIKVLSEHLIFRKNSSWEYEKEWRYFYHGGPESEKEFELKPFTSSDLVSVNFGLKTFEADVSKLKKMAISINPSVRFFRAKAKGNTLEFIEI